MDDTDVEVVRLGYRFAGGEEAALVEAYERWSVLVHALALRLRGSRADADDVTQQVFVAAWRTRGRYDPGRTRLPAWLIGITRRTLADAHEARAETSRLRAVPDVDQIADRIVIQDKLSGLAEPAGTILHLAFFWGLTHVQIAHRLRLSPGTVRNYLHTSLALLRDRLEVGAMAHIDDELLALHALGELLPRADRDHVYACPVCVDAVRRLERVVDALNAPASTARLAVESPNAGVWLRVRVEIDLSPADEQERVP